MFHLFYLYTGNKTDFKLYAH